MAARKKDNFQVYVKQIEAISKVANLITSGMFRGWEIRPQCMS